MFQLIPGELPAHDGDLPSDPLGTRARTLHRLASSGIPVVDTIVLDSHAFGQYQRAGILDGAVVDRVLAAIQTQGFGRATALALRPSLSRDYTGLPEVLHTEAHYTGIRYGIEVIYRAWSDERCVASRYTQAVSGAESWPAVIVQPVVDPLYSMVSRSARTGRRVGPEDGYNVNIRVDSVREAYIDMAARVEAALSMPSKFAFTDDGGRQLVVDVEPQVMLDRARDVALSEMLAAGHIDEVEFLLGLNVEDMVEYSSFFEDGYESDEYVQGIAASPGVVRAQLGFRTTPLEEFQRRPMILAVKDASPKDVPHVVMARGAIGTTGGKASHLAVICRGFGKPCVVGLEQLRIDEDSRQLQHSSQAIPEFAEVLLSGTTGRLYLTKQVQAGYRVKRENSELVRRVAAVVSRLSGSDRIRGLTLPDQIKFAHAVEILRRVEAI